MEASPYIFFCHPEWRDGLIELLGEESVNRDYLFPFEIGTIDDGFRFIGAKVPLEYFPPSLRDLFAERAQQQAPRCYERTQTAKVVARLFTHQDQGQT